MSRSLDVVLKHGYAPREQYSRHGRQGPFTDVYSLAATFYRCITGIVPQDSIDRLDDDMLVTPRYYCPDLTPQGEFALFKALAVQPADRFQTTQQFKECLLTTGQVPPALFRPAPVGGAQPAVNRNTASTGNSAQVSSVSTQRSQTPTVHQTANPAVSTSYPPAGTQSAPVSQNPGPRAAQTFEPQKIKQPKQKKPKQPKAFSPLKTTLVSFGISMAVFGAILLIILLTR